MPITIYTPKQVVAMANKLVTKYKSNAAAARAIGCTPAVLCQVLAGKVPAPPSVCDALGITREKLYAAGVEDRHRVDPD